MMQRQSEVFTRRYQVREYLRNVNWKIWTKNLGSLPKAIKRSYDGAGKQTVHDRLDKLYFSLWHRGLVAKIG